MAQAQELAQSYNCAECGGRGYIMHAHVFVDHSGDCPRWHYMTNRHPKMIKRMVALRMFGANAGRRNVV